MGSNGQVKLKEIADFQNGGGWTADKYSVSGIPVVRVSDIHEETIDLSDCKYLPKSLWDKYSKHGLKEDDLVICTVGSHPTQPGSVVGRSCRVPAKAEGALLNQNAVRIRPATENLDKEYLSYLGASDLMRNYIIAHAKGSANQVRMSITNLKKFSFELPPIQVQQKIASILSAFDDLIENNSRRIEILEEMARLIYREWFVHFRYPSHENDELVDSGTELGEIPEGWEVQPIGDVIDAMGGGTPKTKVDKYWNGGTTNWFTPSDLTSSGRLYIANSGRKITDEGLDNSSAKMFPPYSVMMTSRATLGVIAFNTEPASVNQGFIVCIPNEKVSAYQIYFWLQENMQRMINQASGATYKEIRKTDFREMNFPIIDEGLQEKFVDKVELLFKQIENLEKKNEKLKETRDLLLPKLISGEIDVEEVTVN